MNERMNLHFVIAHSSQTRLLQRRFHHKKIKFFEEKHVFSIECNMKKIKIRFIYIFLIYIMNKKQYKK